MAGDWRVSIRTGLSVGVVIAVLATAALVHIPWSLTARNNVNELTERLNGEIVGSLSRRIGDLLDSATSTQQTIATTLAANVVDPDDVPRIKGFLLAALAEMPALTSISFIRPDDRAVTVHRGDDGTLESIVTTPTPDGAAVRQDIETVRLDEQGRFQAENGREGRSTQFPTRQYWVALAEREPTWSNIYPMAGSGQLGFTAAGTVGITGGGIIAVSFELERISAFLRDIEVSPNGTVFLTNIYGELLAGQEPVDTLPEPGVTPFMIGKLQASSLPSVRVAATAIAERNLSLADLRSPQQLVARDETTNERFFVTVAPLAPMGLIVAIVKPEGDILGGILANTRFLTLLLIGFIVVIGVFVVWFAHRSLARPLVTVTDRARKLGDFEFARLEPAASWVSEIDTLSGTIGQMSASLYSFQKYVPVEVVRDLFAQGMKAELGGDHRPLSILFMDLANFTRLSEELGEALIPLLAVYLDEMSATLRAEHATIDKYIGDAIMAFWGAPAPTDQHATMACRAALACQSRLAAIRAERQGSGPELRARIGINTGRVLVGNVGSQERLNYTAIGDPVNVASRLEALNKLYGTEILIGEETCREAGPGVLARRLDRVAVYGKAQGIIIYELLAMDGTADPVISTWVSAFHEGLDAVAARDWDRAETLFGRVIEARNGTDRPSSLYLDRLETWRRDPPPPDWDGLVVIGAK